MKTKAILILPLLFLFGCGEVQPISSEDSSTSSSDSLFPHSDSWEQPSSHGKSAATIGTSNCLDCHIEPSGTALPACSSCHAVFPHTNASWYIAGTVGRTLTHPSTYIEDIRSGVASPCLTCHVEDAAWKAGLVTQCTSCHPNGVTHGAQWGYDAVWRSATAIPDHGTYYTYSSSTSSPIVPRYDSASEPFCKDCHGHSTLAVTPLTDTQTKADLVALSDCYECHWTSPHVSYQTNTVSLRPWNRSTVGRGHISYLSLTAGTGSPLVTTSDGTRPTGANDTNWTAATQNSCGGSGGGCHTNGNRSCRREGTSSVLQCRTACHGRATAPSEMVRPLRPADTVCTSSSNNPDNLPPCYQFCTD